MTAQSAFSAVRRLRPAIESQRSLECARQYRSFANKLVDMAGPEPNWTKWFLMAHAIELVIKAFIAYRDRGHSRAAS